MQQNSSTAVRRGMKALDALLAGRPAPVTAGGTDLRVGRYLTAAEYDQVVAAHAQLTELVEAAQQWLDKDDDRSRERMRNALRGIA